MSKNKKINSLHVIGKTELKSWPAQSQRIAWRIFCKTIHELQSEHEITTRAFVMMSNHYHWLCDFDRIQDPAFFEWFHESVNFHFLHEAQYPDYVLEYQPHIIQLDSLASYRNTYKYIYRNPVTAGLTHKAEDYPFSTLRHVLGHGRKPFNIEDNMGIVSDPIRVVGWINGPWEEPLYFKYH